MKETYKDLRCPHCGAKAFSLIEDDVFLCEYCDQKFNFSVDEIQLTEENSVFVNEIKEAFYEKISALNQKKRESRICLLYYKKRANPRRLINISIIIMAVTFVMLVATASLVEQTIAPTIVSAVGVAIGVALFVIAKIHNKNMAKKYQYLVTYFASEVADYDNQISTYTKMISKLTK